MQGRLRVAHGSRRPFGSKHEFAGGAAPTVEVLLSTFNGASFLDEQLASIDSQSLAPRRILIRDDGSEDTTLTALSCRAQAPGYEILSSKRLGSTKSYFELLRRSAANIDYVSFADQDDIWKPGKLQRAVSVLEATGSASIPLLYCSRVEIVDAKLRPLGLTPLAPYHASLENALVQNIAIGCTTVLNRAARDLLLQHEPPNFAYHDWWAYLVVSAFGIVTFDAKPTMLYRQHSANHVGAKASRLGRFLDKVRRQLGARPFSLRRQADAFLRCYGSALTPTRRRMVEEFVRHRSFTDRVAFATNMPQYRQNAADSFAMRVLYAARSEF